MSNVVFNSHKVINLSQRLHRLLLSVDDTDLEFALVKQLTDLQAQLQYAVSQLESGPYFNSSINCANVDYLSQHGWGD